MIIFEWNIIYYTINYSKLIFIETASSELMNVNRKLEAS